MPDVKRVVRRPASATDDAFAMMMKDNKEPEPSEEEKPDPLAKYGVPPFEEWNPPF